MARFGREDEFNNLGWGDFVYPYTSLGLRPTFRISIGTGASGGFYASPYPAMSTIIQNGFEWLTTSPFVGSVVATDFRDEVNIIAGVPYLVSAPVDLAPVLPSEITREEWAAAGLDPDHQANLWALPDDSLLDIQMNFRGQGYNMDNQSNVTLGAAAAPASHPYTEGFACDRETSFIVVKHLFSILPLQDAFMPAGEYRFRIDLKIIPSSKAYKATSEIPVLDWYRNVNLDPNANYPTASIDVVGAMPQPFPIPKVLTVTPSEGGPGASIELAGVLLQSTHEIRFSPDARSTFQVVSDNLLQAQVPQLAETGPVVVETARGFAISPNEFTVQRLGDRFLPRRRVE